MKRCPECNQAFEGALPHPDGEVGAWAETGPEEIGGVHRTGGAPTLRKGLARCTRGS